MRIGIESSALLVSEPTGIEYSLAQLVARLPQAGTHHTYALHFNFVRPQCAARFEERVRPLLADGRVEVRFCRVPSLIVHRLGELFPIEWSLGDCDLVHYPNWWPVRAQRRGACVFTVHDLIPLTHPEHCAPALVERCWRDLARLVDRADALIAVSQHTKAELVVRLGVAAQRIHVVHHGVDPHFRPACAEAVAALRERLGLGRPYLLTVGSCEPRKNLARLLGAFARVRSRCAGHVDLVIAGRSLSALPGLRARIAELGLQGAVHLVGYAAPGELPALYSGAEAFVFPSLAEGFGLPVLEAMACGTAVIAASALALPEVVGDGGLLADPLDPEDLANTMLRVLEDSALRRALVERGRKRAAEFSWERAARQTIAVYEGLA